MKKCILYNKVGYLYFEGPNFPDCFENICKKIFNIFQIKITELGSWLQIYKYMHLPGKCDCFTTVSETEIK